jgi:hypothetical protein
MRPGRQPSGLPRPAAEDHFGERKVRVGELADVGGSRGADEILDCVVDVPDIDVHPGEDATPAEPERDELPLANGEWMDFRSRCISAQVAIRVNVLWR